MASIENRLAIAMNPGMSNDWYKELVALNESSEFITSEFLRNPFVFESIFDTERQVLAWLKRERHHKLFPRLTSAANAINVGIIPAIADSFEDSAAAAMHQNAKLIQLSQRDKTLGEIFNSFGRTNLGQADHNYISNNAHAISELATRTYRLLSNHGHIRMRSHYAYPSIMYETLLRKSIEGRERIDESVYLSPSQFRGMGALDSLADPLVASLPRTHRMEHWDGFAAYAEFILPDDFRLILAPRQIPWQALLRVVDGSYVPVMTPLAIPLLNDTAWLVNLQSTHESPKPLSDIKQLNIGFFHHCAIWLATLAMCMTALAGTAKVGKGNPRLHWCSTPWNYSHINHLLFSE